MMYYEGDIREILDEFLEDVETDKASCKKIFEEAQMWRKRYLDSIPLMINEDRDRRIRAIFLAIPAEEFINRPPEQILEDTIRIFKNPSQPEK